MNAHWLWLPAQNLQKIKSAKNSHMKNKDKWHTTPTEKLLLCLHSFEYLCFFHASTQFKILILTIDPLSQLHELFSLLSHPEKEKRGRWRERREIIFSWEKMYRNWRWHYQRHTNTQTDIHRKEQGWVIGKWCGNRW